MAAKKLNYGRSTLAKHFKSKKSPTKISKHEKILREDAFSKKRLSTQPDTYKSPKEDPRDNRYTKLIKNEASGRQHQSPTLVPAEYKSAQPRRSAVTKVASKRMNVQGKETKRQLIQHLAH